MGLIEKADIQEFLKDEKFIDEVVNKCLEGETFVGGIAEDMADKIADELENDPKFKEKMLAITKKDPYFKRKILDKLVDELN